MAVHGTLPVRLVLVQGVNGDVATATVIEPTMGDWAKDEFLLAWARQYIKQHDPTVDLR